MATSRMAVQAQLPVGMDDGVTNTHIRKQIQRLRLLKGWTKHDLEQAAGIAAHSLDELESGVCHINVDILRKIIRALESDITEVWPVREHVGERQAPLPTDEGTDPLYFSRLAEIHSLTRAEASCMFTGDSFDETRTASGEKRKPGLRALCTINLDWDERQWLSRKLLQGTVEGPWATYRYCESGRSLYLCLKNARLGFWDEDFIKRCLAAWLAAPSELSW